MTASTNPQQPTPGTQYVHRHIPNDNWRECVVCGLTFEHYHPEGWQKPKDFVMGLPESTHEFSPPTVQQPVDDELRKQITLYVSALASSGKNFIVEGEAPPINNGTKHDYVNRFVEIATAYADRRADKRVEEARLDEVTWYSNQVHITKKISWDKYEVMRKNQIRATHHPEGGSNNERA